MQVCVCSRSDRVCEVALEETNSKIVELADKQGVCFEREWEIAQALLSDKRSFVCSINLEELKRMKKVIVGVVLSALLLTGGLFWGTKVAYDIPGPLKNTQVTYDIPGPLKNKQVT